MALEILRAQLRASGQLREELASTAVTATAAGDAIDDLGDEAASSSASAAVLSEGLDETAQESAAASARAALLEQRLESVGDEATQSAAQLGVFSAAAESAAGSSVRANLAGLSGPLTRVGAVAAAATPAVLGLGSALGGVAGFSGLGGLAAGGLTAAGIQARAEEMAAFSTELEDAAAAREELFANFKSQLADAFAPIQNADATQQFALRNLEAVVDIAEDASTSLQAVDDTVIGVASGLREAAVAASPATFEALATQTERLAPLFSRLDGAISDLPQLINFLGDATARVGPDLFTLAAAAIPVAAGLAEVGIAVSDVLLPPLNASLFVLGGLLSTFQMLPAPLQNAAVAFGVLAAAGVMLTSANYALSTSMFTLTGATTALTGALTALTAPLSVPIVIAAALGAAIVGLATHFGLLNDATDVLTGTWNTLVEVAEASINSVLGAAKAVGDFLGPLSLLVPGFGPAIFVISHWTEIMNTAGDVVEWLGARIRWLARQADKYLGPVLDMIGDASDRIDEAGGVELDAAKFGDSDDSDGSDGSSDRDGGDDPPPAPPAAGTSSTSSEGVTVDMSNSEFGGSTSKSKVKQWVREGVKEANRGSRRREDAQGG